MKRVTTLIYGIASRAVFLATFLYAIGFIGNLIVPKSIDSVPTVSQGAALFVNTLLLSAFGFQHTLMASHVFERAWARIIPEVAGHSTYVLFSSLPIILLFALWQPMGGIIWDVQNALSHNALLLAYGVGWALVFTSTLAINRFDLIGFRQMWVSARTGEYMPLQFRQPLLYHLVRQPLRIGWILVFWATPIMTVAHLFLAFAMTVYILIATTPEDRRSVTQHG